MVNMSQQQVNANNLQLPGQESSSASPQTQVQAQNQQAQVPTLAQNQVRGGVQATRGGKKPTRGRGRGTMTVTPPMYGNLTPPPQMLQQLQIQQQQMQFQAMQPSQQFPRGQPYYPPQIALQQNQFMMQQQLSRQQFIAPQPQINQQAMGSQSQQPMSLQQRSDYISKQIRNIRQSLESTELSVDMKQAYQKELTVKTQEFNDVQEQLKQQQMQNRNTVTTGQKIEQKQQQTSQMSPATSAGQILVQKGSIVQKTGLMQKPQTIAASPLTPNPTLGQAAADFDAENGSKGQLLKSRKIQELVAEIDPNERVHPDVEQILLEVADQFIASVAEGAVLNALHRGSNTLEVKDIQLFLEKNYNIRIPGFASDEIRSVRKTNILPNHATKLQAINQQKSAPPHSTTNITPPTGQPPKPVAKKRPREEPAQDTSKQKKLPPNK